jgi:hypothetical protein
VLFGVVDDHIFGYSLRTLLAHYVYLLRDPRTGEARYVGETKDPKYRLQHHIGGQTVATRDWILELRCLCLVPKMQVVQKLATRALSLSAEREIISGLLKAGAHLLNIKDTPADVSNIARRAFAASQAQTRGGPANPVVPT